MSNQNHTTARWVVSLYATCPNCGDFVDLLDDDEFWDGRDFQVAESETENSREVEVSCPECHHEFIVDLEY